MTCSVRASIGLFYAIAETIWLSTNTTLVQGFYLNAVVISNLKYKSVEFVGYFS